MQSAPLGAQCATHTDVAAAFVCTRCGTFVCAPCGVDDQGRCARCAVPSGFPFDATASVDQLVRYAWSACRRELPRLAAATLVALLIVALGYGVGTVISVLTNFVLRSFPLVANVELGSLSRLIVDVGLPQIVDSLLPLPTNAFAALGLSRLAIDALEGRKVQVARMFRLAEAFPSFAMTRVVLFLVTVLPSVMFGLVTTFVARRIERVDASLVTALLELITQGWWLISITLIVVSLPFQFFPGPECLLSGVGGIESLQRAWSLASGQWRRLLGYSLLFVALIVVGAVALGIGLLVAIPFAWLVMTAFFLSLRRTAGWPVSSR